MSTSPEDQGTATDEQAPAPEVGVWGEMAAAHNAITAARKPLYLLLPGYEHMGLAARYKYVPVTGEDSDRAVGRLRKLDDKPTEQQMQGAALELAMACDHIALHRPKDPEADPDGYVPLTDTDGGFYRYDRALLRGLKAAGANVRTETSQGNALGAAQIVREVFGGTNGERQLLRHWMEVVKWMAGEREDVADDFLGG